MIVKHQVSRLLCAALPVVLLLTCFAPRASGEVVYDTLTDNPSAGGSGCCLAPYGQAIALSGTQREITLFEVRLGSVGAATFLVEFYDLDGPNGEPGTLIWQSPIQTYPYTPPFYNEKILPVAVPNITVPDSFLWTLTTVQRENNILYYSATALRTDNAYYV